MSVHRANKNALKMYVIARYFVGVQQRRHHHINQLDLKLVRLAANVLGLTVFSTSPALAQYLSSSSSVPLQL